MSILVVGSVAFDSIETPHGKVDHCLGAEFGDCFFELWVEDVDEEVVEEGRQGAHGDMCGRGDDILQTL